MSRKPLLILCAINLIVGIIVLAIGIPKLLAKRSAADPSVEKEKLSNNDLWGIVMSSTSIREANYYLNQIDNPDFKRQQVETRLGALISQENKATPLFGSLQQDIALINAWNRLKDNDNSLELLRLIFENRTLPITLREAALINHTQAYAKHREANHNTSASSLTSQLIADAYKEQNSLQGTALRAEWFLNQNANAAAEPSVELRERISKTLLHNKSLESNRIACIEMLQSPQLHSLVDNEKLYALYANNSSNALKIAILAYFSKKKDSTTQLWLSQLEPSSPKLEQYQLAALEALNTRATERVEGNHQANHQH